MTQAKPWKPFAEQLALVKSRGLQVDNEPAALDYLERIGFYRLSGYWYSFRRLVVSGGFGIGRDWSLVRISARDENRRVHQCEEAPVILMEIYRS